jgi:hypothetical protein
MGNSVMTLQPKWTRATEKMPPAGKDVWTYDGNEAETYNLFRNGKMFAELFCSEDDAIEMVQVLNNSNLNKQYIMNPFAADEFVLVIDEGTESESVTTLGQFLSANEDSEEPLDEDMLSVVRLKVGEETVLGGGAAAEFKIKRVQ